VRARMLNILKGRNKMKLQLHEMDKIPKVSGIYFVFSKEEIIYIGVSEYLKARVNAGRLIKDFLKFGITSIQYFCIEKKQIYGLETYLIEIFNPIANRTLKQKSKQKVVIKKVRKIKVAKLPQEKKKRKISKYDRNPTWWQTCEVL
jgi:hypothetical protein